MLTLVLSACLGYIAAAGAQNNTGGGSQQQCITCPPLPQVNGTTYNLVPGGPASAPEGNYIVCDYGSSDGLNSIACVYDTAGNIQYGAGSPLCPQTAAMTNC
ncbi:hypothetical protein PAXINDRAFT_6442 [Paxillus involutus ATCC 200175]|nr:hypothetical protein PAXINDRAFT_6442 [Paxillus involutus ATCC 200175]